MTDAVFTSHGGNVYRRGAYMPDWLCVSLLEHLRTAPTQSQWEANINSSLARQLEDAMHEAFGVDVAA